MCPPGAERAQRRRGRQQQCSEHRRVAPSDRVESRFYPAKVGGLVAAQRGSAREKNGALIVRRYAAGWQGGGEISSGENQLTIYPTNVWHGRFVLADCSVTR